MLTMDLRIRDFDGQAVVALRGKFDLADAPDVASHLIAAVAACGPSVIVDMADLEGIGYSGLSVLLRVRKWTRRSGGDLSLAALQQPVRRVLEATGLIDVFSVYPSVEQAASSARQARRWSPAAPRRTGAATVTRHTGRRPPAGMPRRPSFARRAALPRRVTCRSRHIARDTCVKRRSPGGATAA